MNKIYLIIGLAMLSSCSSDKKTDWGVWGNHALVLKEDEKILYEKQVLSGDPSKAITLYSHYAACSAIDDSTPFRWELIGIKLNDVESIHHINSLRESYIPDNTRLMAMPKNAFHLSESAVKLKSQEALKGAGEPAFWLFMYYKFSANNPEEAEKYRQIATKYGIEISKESYWHGSLDGPYKWQDFYWITRKDSSGKNRTYIEKLSLFKESHK